MYLKQKISFRFDKPDKNLEKNSDPPIISPIIREKKSSLIFAVFQSQMCPQSPLVVMHIHTRPLGCRWCDKPNKNLEKNSDPPIIRERKKSSLIFAVNFQS